MANYRVPRGAPGAAGFRANQRAQSVGSGLNAHNAFGRKSRPRRSGQYSMPGGGVFLTGRVGFKGASVRRAQYAQGIKTVRREYAKARKRGGTVQSASRLAAQGAFWLGQSRRTDVAFNAGVRRARNHYIQLSTGRLAGSRRG